MGTSLYTTNVGLPLDDYYATEQYWTENILNEIYYPSGGLWGWGANYNGLLGDGTTVNKSSPIQIGTLTNWKSASIGRNYSSALIKMDGTLWTCGYNNFGQLGDGTTVNKSSPIQIGTLTNWKSASYSDIHLTLIKTDGTLWTCGYNNGSSGNMGLNSNVTLKYSSPVQVGSLTNWKQVSSGYSRTTAVKTDGTLWSWGYNGYGQLGDGTIVNKSSPVQVGSLTNWKQVSSGYSHATAVKTDGTLWSWGRNDYGQLGDGTIVDKSSPVQVGSLTNWKQVSCGNSHTTAVKTDGTLWSWGYNGYGQLGDGTIVNKSSPVQVGSLTNWKQVSCELGNHTAAIKTDGTLWTTGNNNNYQLGDGTYFNRSSPIQIGSLTNWKTVISGFTSTIAIK